MKEEQENSRQATQESAAGQTRPNSRKGGRIQGGVEAEANLEGPLYPERPLPVRFFPHDLVMDGILDVLACQVFSSRPRHGWDLSQRLPAVGSLVTAAHRGRSAGSESCLAAPPSWSNLSGRERRILSCLLRTSISRGIYNLPSSVLNAERRGRLTEHRETQK